MEETETFDVLIIGGSFAGMSAALTLGRSHQKTLVIDSNNPCNKNVPHSHNFLAHDGEKPSDILATAKNQILKYSCVQFFDGKAIVVTKKEKGFEVLVENKTFTAKKILLAAGVKDVLPDIPGFETCWGISALHCPYCHGYESTGKITALLGNDENAFNMAILLTNWSDKIILLSNGFCELTNAQKQTLQTHGIEVIEKEIKYIEEEDGWMRNIYFTDATCRKTDIMYAKVKVAQHAGIIRDLNLEINDNGYLITDDKQETSVENIYAAGDCTTQERTLAAAVASGTRTAMMINGAIAVENFYKNEVKKLA
jgi:thioredoxin reductase